MEPLERWLKRQYRHSAAALLRSVSAVQITKIRQGFGQTVIPRKGSVVASPALGAYDPLPDYFFHWYRDSAIVIDALRVLSEDASIDVDAAAHFADFVRFSLSLFELDGRALVSAPWRGRASPDYRKFLRTDDELSCVHGETVAGETRVNPDGSIDISKWPRPQNDGPALRALCLMRWLTQHRLDGEVLAAAGALLRADLVFTQAHWRQACFDIWEEEMGLHYYTLRVAAAALAAGADWLEQHGDGRLAAACRADRQAAMLKLDEYWREDGQFYRSRFKEGGAPSPKELDMSVILAALHAAESGRTHTVFDARMHATLAHLEALFDAEYAINRGRTPGSAPAMGRYAEDVYFSGGAYYFSTLAAAEFYFRASVRAPAPWTLVARGDAFLDTVRRFTPTSGDMSEQFDQRTGIQQSAPQLAWSYAALISCAEARRLAIGSAQGGA